MKINKITRLKNNKYKITIDDNTIVTYDDVIIEYGLLYKKEINKSLYDKIIESTEFYKIYNDALKFALKKIRCENEILDHLNKYNLSKENIDKIVIKLKNINLINDKKYVRAYINDKLSLSKYGIKKIKKDLMSNNIDIDIINSELESIDKDDELFKLEKLILKKINNNHKYSNNYLKEKILNEMINLGYNNSDIIDILDMNLKEDDIILKNEYNKIYNKLKTKYRGIELNQKVKQKLTIKGFNSYEIDSIIKETED